MKNTKLFLLTLALVYSTMGSLAHANDCTRSLQALEESTQFPVLDRTKGITAKGFVSGFPAPTVENSKYYGILGFMDWTLSAFVVRSEEEALATHLRFNEANENDPVVKAVFLIVPESKIHEVSEADRESTLPEYKTYLKTARMIYFDTKDNKTVIEVPLDDRERFNPDRIRVSFFKPMETIIFSNLGWTFPDPRGILLLETLRKSQTHKNLQYEARRYYRRGYRFRVNYDFEGAITTLETQPRKGQSATQSRYAVPLLREKMRNLYKAGNAYTIEVLDPEGKVAGGILGVIYGSLVNIDTTFGDDILFARMAVLALADFAEAHGIKFIDMGMRTKYSKSVKTEYMGPEIILPLIDSITSESTFTMSGPSAPTEWTPKMAE